MPLKLNTEDSPTINLTSMIDVLFLLIIFFMVGTRFADSEGSVKIPKVADANQAAASNSFPTLSLLTDGTIDLGGQRMTLDVLKSVLTQATRANPEYTVKMKPDAQCSVQQLVEVLEAINRSGAKVYGLSANNMPNRARR